MTEIKVEKIGGWEFRVEVQEGGSRTTHRVTLDEKFVGKLGWEPERVVRESFKFLLKRESKESILPSFSIPDTINRYFPDFEAKIGKTSD